MNSIWTGYGHKIVLKESGNGKEYAVKVDNVVTLFGGSTHAHPEEAAKAFFFSKMEDLRSAATK